MGKRGAGAANKRSADPALMVDGSAPAKYRMGPNAPICIEIRPDAYVPIDVAAWTARDVATQGIAKHDLWRRAELFRLAHPWQVIRQMRPRGVLMRMAQL